MRDHLIKARATEQAIHDWIEKNEPDTPTSRAIRDVIDLRTKAMDALLDEDLGPHPSSTFSEAMERIRQHFDKDSPTPYKTWRGATPADQPSLPKDIRIIFEQLMLEGIWQGEAPILDQRWNPSS